MRAISWFHRDISVSSTGGVYMALVDSVSVEAPEGYNYLVSSLPQPGDARGLKTPPTSAFWLDPNITYCR